MGNVITVGSIWDEIQSVIGTCDVVETYNKINRAQENLTNMGNWDSTTVNLDICTQDCEITLPDDILVPLAVNLGGRPADFQNKWYEYHLNGPGSDCAGSCGNAWQDRGTHPIFRDLIRPSKIAAYTEAVETETAIRVYGYDNCGKWIMEADCDGVLRDGFDVPILSGFATGMPSEKIVKRITRVSKPVTNGFIKLVGLDAGSHSGGTLLGYYRPYETEPQYRRIKVNGGRVGSWLAGCRVDNCNTGCAGSCTTWVRMIAKKKTYLVSHFSDVIPLTSVTAVKLMCQALRKADNDLLDGNNSYTSYKAAAKIALNEEQKTRSGPNQIRVQIQRGGFMSRPGENMQ